MLKQVFVEVEQFTNILNTAPGRAGRPKLDVHNIIYWFKNTRAALRRAEIRQIRSSTFNIDELRSYMKSSDGSLTIICSRQQSAGSVPCETEEGKKGGIGGMESIYTLYRLLLKIENI